MRNIIASTMGALVAILVVCSDISLIYADKEVEGEVWKDLQIQYLKRTNLNISSVGVNRLNFGDTRIVKIVGDSSLYGLN